MSKRDGIPAVPFGFDYARAVLELRKMMSHEAIAAYCGYEAPSSIHRLVCERRREMRVNLPV